MPFFNKRRAKNACESPLDNLTAVGSHLISLYCVQETSKTEDPPTQSRQRGAPVKAGARLLDAAPVQEHVYLQGQERRSPRMVCKDSTLGEAEDILSQFE